MTVKTVTAFCRAFGVKYNNCGAFSKQQWKDSFEAYKANPYVIPNVPNQIQEPVKPLSFWNKPKPIPKNVRIVNG